MTVELEHRVRALETLVVHLFIALNAIDKESGPAIVENFDRLIDSGFGNITKPTILAHKELAEEMKNFLAQN